VIFLVTLFSTSGMWNWRYQEWVQTSQQFHEQLILIAPFAAAAATYCACRLTGPTRIFAQPCAVRSGAPVVRRHLGLLGGWFLLAYLLGLAPLVVLTVLRAEAEGPDLLAMLTGLAGLAAVIGIGYLVGVVTGSAWPAPFVFVVMFVILQATAYYHDTFAAVDPVIHFDATLGRTEAVPITLYRLAFFLLVVVVTAVLAARALTRSRRVTIPSPGAAALLILVAAGIVVPMVWTPALLAEETNPSTVCQRSSRLTYCVHAGHRSELATLRATAADVFRVSGPPPPSVRRVRDAALATPGDDLLAADTVWVHLYPGESTRQDTLPAVADAVAGVNICTARYGVTTSVPQSEQLASNLASAIQQRAGYPGAVAPTRFDRMTPAQFRNWVAAHRPAIAACGLTTQQMP
ncbi:MAG: hypothetical protein ACRDQ5_19700, partial [Sciscionella sp.]